jgi:plastocyanin
VVEKGLVHDLAGADGVKHDAGAEWTYTHTYSAPATYAFLCTLHAGMNGTVTVQ